jgi:hypothetical protein
MSLKIVPPFTVVPRLSEGNIVDLDEINLRQLRDAVAGKNRTFPRARAMDLLLTTDFPNKHRDFEAVLENNSETPEDRALAAINLAKVNTPASLDVLIKHIQTDDELVLTCIMKALGRIGDKSALNAILKFKEGAKGLAAEQAKFAASLISHRLGLPDNELPIPDEEEYVEICRDAARPFQINLAGSNDAEFCLRSLADQSFGIEFAEYPMYQVCCGRNNWMILFNRDFIGQDMAKKLGKKKAFPGLIAIRSEASRLYSVAFLILTSPAKQPDKVNILIHRPNGGLIFSGSMQVKENRLEFSIYAIARSGVFPIRVVGAFEDGELQVKTALSEFFVQGEKRQPLKEVLH